MNAVNMPIKAWPIPMITSELGRLNISEGPTKINATNVKNDAMMIVKRLSTQRGTY